VAGKLTLVGPDEPQMQPQMEGQSGRRWTGEKEREFLAVLAETCNVTRAAEAISMSTRGAYKRRRRNGAFRAAWLEAISTAYQQLELTLLDRAFNGTEKVITRSDGSEARMREYPNQLGLSLLKMHRGSVAAAEPAADLPAEEVGELRERLLARIERLKKRREQEAQAE
jgi:hypothetical protein